MFTNKHMFTLWNGVQNRTVIETKFGQGSALSKKFQTSNFLWKSNYKLILRMKVVLAKFNNLCMKHTSNTQPARN